MYEKVVDTYSSSLIHVSSYYKTQNVFKKAGNMCPFMLDYILNCFKTQEMCEKTVTKQHFISKNCLDIYKTQEVCDRAVDACLLLLKYVPDWVVTKKMLKDLIMLYLLMMI